MMMEKEQEVQEQNHVRMNLEMNHHHEERPSSTRPGAESVRPQFDTLSISELVRNHSRYAFVSDGGALPVRSKNETRSV